jgi:hypothetical protein
MEFMKRPLIPEREELMRNAVGRKFEKCVQFLMYESKATHRRTQLRHLQVEILV